MYCTKCGAVNSDDSSFCAHCGNLMTDQVNMDTTQLSTGNTFEYSKENPVGHKKKVTMWAIFAAVFVVVLVAMILVISGDGGSNGGIVNGTETMNAIIEKPANPMESMAYEDAKHLFLEEYPDFAMKSISTVKSMTEDKIYEIMLSVTAENQYALWAFEMELVYTQYDQGWMMDDYSLYSEGYELVRFPEKEALHQIAQNCLNNLEEYESVTIKEITYLEYSEDTEFIYSQWTGYEEMMHGRLDNKFGASFSYAPYSDQWILAEMENESGNKEYDLELLESIPVYDSVDFSGTWSDDEHAAYYGTITISNYSTEEMDVYISGNQIAKASVNDKQWHFVKTEAPGGFKNDGRAYYYNADLEYYLVIVLCKDKTVINISQYISGYNWDEFEEYMAPWGTCVIDKILSMP